LRGKKSPRTFETRGESLGGVVVRGKGSGRGGERSAERKGRWGCWKEDGTGRCRNTVNPVGSGGGKLANGEKTRGVKPA